MSVAAFLQGCEEKVDDNGIIDTAISKGAAFKSLVNIKGPILINHATDDEIKHVINKVKSQTIDVSFLNHFLDSIYNIPNDITQIILTMIPFNNATQEFFQHFDCYDTFENSDQLEISSRVNSFIDKFLFLTGLYFMKNSKNSKNSENSNMKADSSFIKNRINNKPESQLNNLSINNNKIQKILMQYIDTIYYFRLGDEKAFGRMPQQPSDIIGQMSNKYKNVWFYYKDGHPNWFGATTHSYFFGIIDTSLIGLLKQMDIYDINLFANNIKQFTPMEMQRCGCFKCQDEWKTKHGKQSQNNENNQTDYQLLILDTSERNDNRNCFTKCCEKCTLL